MARFLCTVWPFPGHLHPTIALAQALRARGHDVAIYSGEAARAVVEGQGFTFFPFDLVAARLQEVVDGVAVGQAGHDDDAFYDRLTARYSRLYHGKALAGLLARVSYREWILGTVTHQVADLDVILDRWRPDALVCDPTMWAPFLVLHERDRLPVAMFSFLAGCALPGPDAIPPSRRPRTWYGRVFARLATRAMDVVAADVRRSAGVVRARYGLPGGREAVYSLSGRMPLYLVATTLDYDYNRRDLPPSVHYVGACLWDKPNYAAPPAWLSGLGDGRPAVYVTEGTSHVYDARLLRTAAEGLAGMDLTAVLTTGVRRDAASLGITNIAPNIRVEQFVPHSDLFPRISAVVTNGGSGTVRAALTAGLPLVVVPMEWDQFDNARRIVEAGAGVHIDAKRCTPERLRSAVQQVLYEPSFRASAQRLGAASDRAGGPDRAAELLEILARRAPMPRRGAPTTAVHSTTLIG